jgi:hypothetical protein
MKMAPGKADWPHALADATSAEIVPWGRGIGVRYTFPLHRLVSLASVIVEKGEFAHGRGKDQQSNGTEGHATLERLARGFSDDEEEHRRALGDHGRRQA